MLLDKIKEIYPGNKEKFDDNLKRSTLQSEENTKTFNIENYQVRIIFNNDGTAQISIKDMSDIDPFAQNGENNNESENKIENADEIITQIINTIKKETDENPNSPLSILTDEDPFGGDPLINELEKRLKKYISELIKTNDINEFIELVQNPIKYLQLSENPLNGFDSSSENTTEMELLKQVLAINILNILKTKNKDVSDIAPGISPYNHLVNELKLLTEKGICTLL